MQPTNLLDLCFITPDGQPCMVLSYYAPYESGDIKLDEDSTEWRWVTADEVKKLDVIQGIEEEIEMVDKILKK